MRFETTAGMDCPESELGPNWTPSTKHRHHQLQVADEDPEDDQATQSDTDTDYFQTQPLSVWRNLGHERRQPDRFGH